MRLFEAIVDANHRALAGDKTAGVHPKDFADSLPVVALTCIDPRLNLLMPQALGIPEEQFIWLRTAGNVITSPTSSTVRSLALACLLKGGKEIAVIGHSDCRVRQTSVMELTERFQALGIDRSRLPENLSEFFGLFGSERQNVMRGVEFVRQSPLIGAKLPVHGLLIDIGTGKLEWLINGYDGLSAAVAQLQPGSQAILAGTTPLQNLPAFNLGEMKFPDFKIGEMAASPSTPIDPKIPAPERPVERAEKRPALRFDKSTLFKVVGLDQKIYGPVNGKEIEQWLSDGRVNAASLVQKVGYKEWKQLAHFAEGAIPVPPPLAPGLHLRRNR